LDILKTGVAPVVYQTGIAPVNSCPLKGKYLSRSLKGKREQAFCAADLYSGAKYLVEPSLAQAALVAGSDVSSVWWALQRMPFRKAILADEMPLVPARPKKACPVPVPVQAGVNDAVLYDLIREIGIDRLLTVAAAVEAQAHY
jgi:hypothetical protein